MSIGLLDTETDTSGKFNLTLREFRRWNADSFWNDAHPFLSWIIWCLGKSILYLRLRYSINFKKKS